MEPAGSFEATVRPAGSRYAVYARYVGAQGGKAPTAGEQVPNRPGYVFSDCTHPVRATEWHAGERTCQPCQDAFAAEMSGGDQPLLLDPDCRDGKHGSCVGGLCECVCHEQDGGRSDG